MIALIYNIYYVFIQYIRILVTYISECGTDNEFSGWASILKPNLVIIFII
jgi:hypothetical protein